LLFHQDHEHPDRWEQGREPSFARRWEHRNRRRERRADRTECQEFQSQVSHRPEYGCEEERKELIVLPFPCALEDGLACTCESVHAPITLRILADHPNPLLTVLKDLSLVPTPPSGAMISARAVRITFNM